MAAHGETVTGNQIFVSIRKGSDWPATVFDVRVRYDQTIGDLKKLVSEKLALPADKLQLFHHKKELTAAYDQRTLAQMNMHTGFAIQGWNLTEAPAYWPSVKQTAEGLMIDC